MENRKNLIAMNNEATENDKRNTDVLDKLKAGKLTINEARSQYRLLRLACPVADRHFVTRE